MGGGAAAWVAPLDPPLTGWSRPLGFSIQSCLVKPTRGGQSRNFTTSIVKQLRQHELGTDLDLSTHPIIQNMRPEVVAAMASATLEDGDVKSAVRLLYSGDKLACTRLFNFRRTQSSIPSSSSRSTSYSFDRHATVSGIARDCQKGTVLPKWFSRWS